MRNVHPEGWAARGHRFDPTKTSVFCGNLAYDVTEDALREFLEENVRLPGLGLCVLARAPPLGVTRDLCYGLLRGMLLHG